MILKIGLTGGIGSGKSTACEIFSELGVPIIDADTIAHNLVEPGMPALEEITKLFGKKAILNDGSLNRKIIRDQIFANETERKKLENILHPAIFKEIASQIKHLDTKYCIVSIPLLLETNVPDVIDRILVIDVAREFQLSRASIRDNASKENIDRIIDKQVSREERRAAADDIVNNEGNIECLRKKIHSLHEFYSRI